MENEKKLFNALTAGDYASAQQILLRYIQQSFVSDALYLHLNKCRLYSIINGVLNALDVSRKEEDAAFFSGLDLARRLLKIENGKRLLQQGLTVVEAAKRTGYIDSKAMARAFKRYESITPGQYRNV